MDNISDIDYLNHSSTPLDLRDYARFGLRAAFIPTLTNVPSFDKRMQILEEFAIKTENEIFSSTKPREKYLEEITAKIGELASFVMDSKL